MHKKIARILMIVVMTLYLHHIAFASQDNPTLVSDSGNRAASVSLSDKKVNEIP